MLRSFIVAATIFAWVETVAAQDVQVTVVSMLASDRHKEVNPKLVQVAELLRKRDPSLTGWKLERETTKSMKLNQKESFPLIEGINAEVTVAVSEDKDKKTHLTVKAPHAGEISYSTVQSKYFPIWTRFQTEKEKERLIFAVMVKAIPKDNGKGKDKQ